MIDLAAVRADTPSCERVLHFNNAGASLMPEPIYRTVCDHLRLEHDIGGYEAAAQAQPVLAEFYVAFASLLRVGREEIAYVENATRAWDMAFYSLPLAAGDRILTHESEYASNYLALLQQARRRGLEIDLVPSDTSGQIDVQAMIGMIRPTTKLIAIAHVPSQGGLVNPVSEVGRVAEEHGLIYLLDACQSVGQIDVDVTDIGCHILSGTGRKFLRGPRGTGFLYVSNEIIETLDPPFIDLHSARWPTADTFEFCPGARRFENWESNVAGRLGLARAAQYAQTLGLANIQGRVTDLATRLRQRLAEIPGVTVHDRGVNRCGIVTFDKKTETPQQLAQRLRADRINISISEIGNARLDFGQRGLTSLARASVHYFNTDQEIERFCLAVG